MQKTITLAAIVLAAALPAQRRAPSQEKMKANWEAKQQEAWFQDGAWIHDFDAAKKKAAKENKVLLAYFSRSYSP